MDNNNDDYVNAVKLVADREADMVSKTADEIDKWLSCTKSSLDVLTSVRTSLPTVASPSAARAQVDAVFNQVNSFYQQMQYTKNNLTSIVVPYEQATVS